MKNGCAAALETVQPFFAFLRCRCGLLAGIGKTGVE